MRQRRFVPVLAASFLALSSTLVACSSTSAPGADAESGTAAVEVQEITVFAAASLKGAFEEIATAFEAEHAGIVVEQLVTDGSSTLATQINEGAPADVFASADEKNMQIVVNAGNAESPELFASNTLVVAVPSGNPGGVESLANLANVTTVLCAPEVPCGSASVRLLEAADVSVTPASLEQNVTAVLQKVAANEADAGLVYATDVIGDAQVESFEPEGAEEVVNRYPLVALKGTAEPNAAQAFVDFVLSEAGQEILAKYGFSGA
ncbi:molybdate ABC transporter substrate-binding protein [Leucobacter denitrificans]|uniref:Molybdate ABC transporter substrate-binding protein n=1 Tax=Leucobacter denitrificans TaxID=683042 RepID=A0A7G9S427_9MICO|nr:molybdate ABC transporter substrate-binding protein [Leucobacter denitrificans]QNN62602.1 molybdate ABC transporter substrate-binding protein [Leucobacter denitrificans]